MYFLSDEERGLLVGRLLPEARRHGVHPELRGWSWREPPLSPVYDVPLSVREVADETCDVGRDLYLRRALGVEGRPGSAAREEAALRRALADVIVDAKRAIYLHGPTGCVRRLAASVEAGEGGLGAVSLRPAGRASHGPIGNGHGGGKGSALATVEETALQRKIAALTSFERQRVAARVQDVLAREPDVGADALVALALPVVVERRANGMFLGLTSHLTLDAVATFEGIVFDVWFGGRHERHRLATAGAALVLESLYGQPVDVGCLVYVTFDGERVAVERDLHVVDDELRQWFLEERDERMRIVSEEIDPGMARSCPAACPYWSWCHGA